METLSRNEISFENNFEGYFMKKATYKKASPQWLPKQKNGRGYLSNNCIAQKNPSLFITRAVAVSNNILFISNTAIAVLGLREQQMVHPSQRLFRILPKL